MRVAKAPHPTQRPNEPPFVCLELNHQWTQTLMTALHRFQWAASWKPGTDIDQAEQDIFTLFSMLLHADEQCGEDRCFEFQPDISFVEWFPNNPFTQPDLITAGYNAPAWYVSNQTTKTVMTDISRFPAGSLPGIIPASGLPHFRVHATGPGTVRLHMFSIVGGSIAQVTVDDDPLTVEMVDLNKDIFSAPPETDEDVIIEREIGAGNHHLDVIIVSMVNDEIPFVYHGGGLKKVEICGDEAVLMPEFKFENCGLLVSWDGGGSWQPVPGWDTFAPECFTGPAGEDGQDANWDDLQFQVENCILQYSKDNKVTWNNVFNWNSLYGDCLLTPDDLQFQVENCILQYSKDGGETWNNVLNWNSILGECLPPNPPPNTSGDLACRSARSFAPEFMEMLATTIEAIYTSGELGSAIAKVNCAAYWEFTEGGVFDAVFDSAYALEEAELLEIFTALRESANQQYFAADLFYAPSSGDWLLNDTNAIQSRVLNNPVRPVWEKIAVNWLMAAWVDDNRAFKTWAWNMMAFPAGWDCGSFDDDTTTEFCHTFDFTGANSDSWYIGLSGNLGQGGYKSEIYQGTPLVQVHLQTSGLGLALGTWFVRVLWDGTTGGTLNLYGTVGGQHVLLSSTTQESASEITISVPTDATQLEVFAFAETGDIYVQLCRITYVSPEPVWPENCE